MIYMTKHTYTNLYEYKFYFGLKISKDILCFPALIVLEVCCFQDKLKSSSLCYEKLIVLILGQFRKKSLVVWPDWKNCPRLKAWKINFNFAKRRVIFPTFYSAPFDYLYYLMKP